MISIDYDNKLSQIKGILRDMPKEVSAEEVILALEDILPPKIIYQEVETKTPKEKLEYLKAYRLEQKRIEAIKNKEQAKQSKIDKALKRTSFFCYNCKQNVKIADPESNKHQLIRRKNDKRPKIQILNICPICSREIKGFGGYLNV